MASIIQSSSFSVLAVVLLIIGHVVYYSSARLSTTSLGSRTMDYSLVFWVVKDLVAMLALFGVYEKTKNWLVVVPAGLLLLADVYYWKEGSNKSGVAGESAATGARPGHGPGVTGV